MRDRDVIYARFVPQLPTHHVAPFWVNLVRIRYLILFSLRAQEFRKRTPTLMFRSVENSIKIGRRYQFSSKHFLSDDNTLPDELSGKSARYKFPGKYPAICHRPSPLPTETAPYWETWSTCYWNWNSFWDNVIGQGQNERGGGGGLSRVDLDNGETFKLSIVGCQRCADKPTTWLCLERANEIHLMLSMDRNVVILGMPAILHNKISARGGNNSVRD